MLKLQKANILRVCSIPGLYSIQQFMTLPNNSEDGSSSVVSETALHTGTRLKQLLPTRTIDHRTDTVSFNGYPPYAWAPRTHHVIILHICSAYPLRRWDPWRQEPDSIFTSPFLGTGRPRWVSVEWIKINLCGMLTKSYSELLLVKNNYKHHLYESSNPNPTSVLVSSWEGS